MTKHKKICAHCKGEEVRVDAWASWDVDAQEWVLHAVFDASYCDECEQACDVEEISMDIKPENVFDGPMHVSVVKYPHRFVDDFDEAKPGPIVTEHVVGADMTTIIDEILQKAGLETAVDNEFKGIV